SQAQIYQIDLEHANKVLSMQDVEGEPSELQEVVDVVTTAKIITKVVTAASSTLTAATLQLTTAVTLTLTTAPSAARKRKGVTKDQMDKEDSRAHKRMNESPEGNAAKKQKLDEKVEELKRNLQIVPIDEDDFYIEATPLALKPDLQAQICKNQRIVHGQAKVKSWKLLESCGVLIITFMTTQLILLVERRYPLTRFTLDQMLNNVRLKVEKESEVSLKLLSFGVNAAMDFKKNMLSI
nr:hypothetical protein [Tanacetum cinerariifolium]